MSPETTPPCANCQRLQAQLDALQARFDALLADSCVRKPDVMPYARHVYHIYAIRAPHRDTIQQALQVQGIHTGIHYPIPVHLQPAYSDLGYKLGDFPVAERMARECLSLPMYAELSEAQQAYITTSLKQVRGE